MGNENIIKDYFYEQYGLLLNDRQARKYRSIIGDMAVFIDFVTKKLGLDDNSFDVKWASQVLLHEAYPSLEGESDPTQSCSAPGDFRAMVLDLLQEGRTFEAYEGALEWLETCVSSTGLTKLRGAMGRRSNAKIQQHGIDPPRKAAGKRYTRLEYLIESHVDTISLVNERLESERGEYFALRLGKGSPQYEELSSEDTTQAGGKEVDHAFASAITSSIKDLYAKKGKVEKKELGDWLEQWATQEGMKYLRSALANKRHLEKRGSEVVVVSKSDRDYLEKIRDKYGYTSLKDAIAHVVETSRKLEATRQ